MKNRTTKEGQKLSSIIIVNYNGQKFLKDCFESLKNQNYSKNLLEIIMVDNGSTDNSVEYTKNEFPFVRVYHNDINNFARALNMGINKAEGEYIGFLNNDVIVDKDWLIRLTDVLDKDPQVGCVGGKILFKNGGINSTGIVRTEDFYYKDRGFGERDVGQYDKIEEVEGICGGDILYRRRCLEDIGPVDEDFVMYFEDADMAARCIQKGWKIIYTPHSLMYHEYRGSNAGDNICYYFCNRNRLLYLAKHCPYELAGRIKTSHFYLNKELNDLSECMPITIKKLIDYNDPETISMVLNELCELLEEIYGLQYVNNLLGRMQVVYGYRKPTIGIYDHALQYIGGGQKYACTMASILQNKYDITYISNKEISEKDLREWYNIDLSNCNFKTIKLPFYEERNMEAIDGNIVSSEMENPFSVVSKESGNYDMFINANMLEKVCPMSNLSIMVCHFPDSHRSKYFYADKYTHLIANSRYGAEWIEKRWGLENDRIIHPPVDMYGRREEKENIILSVARFEVGGSKKQKELAEAFADLCRDNKELKRGWRFIMAGGSIKENPYLEEVKKLVNEIDSPIELKVNLSFEELKSLYCKSKIFWHLCGLDQDDPHLVEHFGMTIVEAMQNYCVPIVFDGGGMKEIVENTKSGFRFNSIEELKDYTLKLIVDEELWNRLSDSAYQRSNSFNLERFEAEVRNFFDNLMTEYSSIKIPRIEEKKGNKMKLAFVVQRYGKEVIGGAETYCRLLAERFKDFFDVEVLTSCALDYMTWDNYYKPGLEYVNGVKVRRFATERSRDIQRFDDLNIRIITHEIKDRHVLEEWMEEQGPYLPQLVEHIKQSGEDYDYFIFITYLYYHTYFGIRLFPEKSILIPLAHDEPPIYFDIFKDIFNLAKGIIYQTPEERDFVNKRFDNSEIYSKVIGIGIEELDISNQEDFLKRNNIDYPYLLYAGRVDASKGCDELFDFFLRYKFIFDNDLKLLLIGKEVLKIPEHRDIIFLGFLSEEDKYSAMSSALVNVIPSPYESNSISALESFMFGRPILVNGKSEVLKGHCMRSGGGLYYYNYNDFAGHLNNFKDDPNSTTVMGERGRDYVLTRYNWKVIINKYLNYFQSLKPVGRKA